MFLQLKHPPCHVSPFGRVTRWLRRTSRHVVILQTRAPLDLITFPPLRGPNLTPDGPSSTTKWAGNFATRTRTKVTRTLELRFFFSPVRPWLSEVEASPLLVTYRPHRMGKVGGRGEKVLQGVIPGSSFGATLGSFEVLFGDISMFFFLLWNF